MSKLTQKEFKILFSNLCCSRCKNEFSISSINEIKREDDILICNLVCEKCTKDFGRVILNFNRKSKQHTPLEIIDGPAPISDDDVIDAHRFIKNNL